MYLCELEEINKRNIIESGYNNRTIIIMKGKPSNFYDDN